MWTDCKKVLSVAESLTKRLRLEPNLVLEFKDVFSMKHWFIAFAALIAATPSASAFDYVAGFKNWSVYRDTVNGEPVCYAVTRAEDKAPKSVTHGDVVFFVTYFRSTRLPQSSLRVSYDLREDLKAKVQVNGKSWALYSVRNEAFANNDDENSIVDSLRKGSDLRVEATSERNTDVAYEFSLSGSSSAIDKAKALCS